MIIGEKQRIAALLAVRKGGSMQDRSPAPATNFPVGPV